IDVLSASENDDKIAWYENDGNQNFTTHIITNDANGAWAVYASDVDGDGNTDVLSASSGDGKIAWYENFTLKITQQPQDKQACPGSTVNLKISAEYADTYQWRVGTDGGTTFTDLSDDAVYSGTSTDSLIIHYTSSMDGYMYFCYVANNAGGQNTDTAVVTVEEDNVAPVITCVADTTVNANENHVYAVNGSELDATATDDCAVNSILNDFNNAETLENAELSEGTHTIVWTATDASENQTQCSFTVTVNEYTGINNLTNNEVKIYPNPAGDYLFVETGFNNAEIKISDISGRILFETKTNERITKIDFNNYPKGIYFFEIKNGKGNLFKKVIKK
ncbi:MAG: T9SS type A sorting domain-containing protein, partial [Chlorobi bacterium]|nr:T9SS type A sorting domain-containing protein [Chlorobiota bacterium]